MPSPNLPSPPVANIHPTIKGVNAPPQRALSHKIPCALTRSITGNQLVNALAMFGKQPASPAPKRNRQVTSEARFQAQPVKIVKSDHILTTRMRTRRGPMRSPSQPSRNFKQRVRPTEGRESITHLNLAQPHLGLH